MRPEEMDRPEAGDSGEEYRISDAYELPEDDPAVRQALEELEAEELKQAKRRTWQGVKESWYDKVPLTVRQLDIIIGCAAAALLLVVLLIARDAMAT